MKSRITQRRFKANKNSSCSMCKPWKRGWEQKQNISRKRKDCDFEQQITDLE